MVLKSTKKYLNKILTFVTVIFLACLMQTHASARNPLPREHVQARSIVTRAKLKKDLTFMCDTLCQGRGFATKGGFETAFRIQREFERIGLMKCSGSYGLRVYVDTSKIGRNLVGMLPGSSSGNDRYIIVGAHYDHLGKLKGQVYPGADANASGVVALLNLADMLSSLRNSGKEFSRNIIFVAFDGKEHDMAGSKALWRMIEKGELKDPKSGKPITRNKISLMVNIDQIGSTLSPLQSGRKDYMIMLGTPSLPESKRNVLASCNKDYALDMDLALTYYGSNDFTRIFYRLSDQRIFIDHGIPAVLFTSGITMNTNKTRDTAETIDLDILKKRIYLICHWIEKMMQ